MRSVWKGSVAFGMVTIPVRLYSATQEHDIRFHQVHSADGGRIRYKRVCEVDGEEVPYADIDKAVERDDGTVITVSKDEIDALAVPSSHEIDVEQFVPAEQIDPVLFNKSYYVEPEERALKPYVLLREALRSTDRIAVCRITLRQRETLAALRVKGDVIVVQTMLWGDEVRDPAFPVLGGDVQLRPQERQMAESLVDSLTDDFEPDVHTDRYAEAVADLVQAKAESGGAVPQPKPAEEEESEDATVTDLVAALRSSVERAKKSRADSRKGGAGSSDEAPKKSAGSAKSSTSDDGKAGSGDGKQSGGAKSGAKSTSGTRKSSTSRKTASSTTEKSDDSADAPAKPRRTRKRSA